MEHAGDNYTNCIWCVWNSNERITIGTGRLGSWRTSGDHPNYYIIENGHNTENSPWDLRRRAVTQTRVKTHQLTLMRKTLIYWRRPEFWEESWRLEDTWCHFNSCEKLSANADVKNSKRVYNYNDITKSQYLKTFICVKRNKLGLILKCYT